MSNNKEAYYFSHDSNARNDEKILAVRMRHGMEGYGIYFALIERLRDNSDFMSVKDYNLIAFDLRVSAEKIKSVVEDFGLFVFTEDGKYFYSESLIKRMEAKIRTQSIKSLQGIKGNLIKHNHLTREELEKMSDDEILEFSNKLKSNHRTATAQRPLRDENLSQGKEKKRKEKKVNEIKEKEREKRKIFSPPTKDEVYKFFLEKKLAEPISKLESEKFVNFYESKGWFVGKTKMKNWKSAASGWINRMNEFSNNQNLNNGSKNKSNNTDFAINR